MKKRLFSLMLALVMLVSLVPLGSVNVSAARYRQYSEDLVELVKEFEGFVDKAYWDVDHWSIGYGTPSTKGATITRKEADLALRDYLDVMEDLVNEFADAQRLNLNQGQFDALVSFTYNCGDDWMDVSGRFRTAVIKGYTGNEFLFAISLWANNQSKPDENLLNRRLSEANLYLNGEYEKFAPSKYGYVIFDANGGRPGSGGDDKMQGFQTRNGAEIMVEDPTRSGYDFVGWFTAARGGKEVKKLTSDLAGKTLYAHWDENGHGGHDDDFEWGTVTGNGVRIRRTPGINTEIVTAVNAGTRVRIYRQTTASGMRWGECDKGWICMNYVDLDDEPYDPGDDTGSGVVIATSGLKVRTGPGTDYKHVASLANGTKVTIYETTRRGGQEWGRIGKDRWVCMEYIRMDGGSSTSESGHVSYRSSVHVRTGPGTDYDKVATLTPGTKVTIYETTRRNGMEWGRIGKDRWVCMSYIELDGSGREEGIVRITAQSGLRIRSGAGTGYAIVGSLKYNERVSIDKITSVNGIEWGHMSKGWICLDYAVFVQ